MTSETKPTIDSATRYFILGVVGVVIFLAGVFVDSDWIFIKSGLKSNYTFLMKYAVTVMTFIIAWRSGVCPVEKRDLFYIRLAFFFTLIGDFFLVWLCGVFHGKKPITSLFSVAGILTFCVMQVVYIIRHGRSFITFPIKINRATPTTRWRIFSAILIYGFALTVLIILYPHIVENGRIMMLPAVLYLMLLATSLWMGWGTLIKSWYPPRNAWLIAGGLSFLIVCDSAVGIETFIRGEASLIANGFVWIFYTPALVLLSLSGYNWRGYDGTVSTPSPQ